MLRDSKSSKTLAIPKQIELDEEKYFDRLEAIIKRDFFSNGQDMPEAPKMSLNEYLRRYTSEDNVAFEEL